MKNKLYWECSVCGMVTPRSPDTKPEQVHCPNYRGEIKTGNWKDHKDHKMIPKEGLDFFYPER